MDQQQQGRGGQHNAGGQRAPIAAPLAGLTALLALGKQRLNALQRGRSPGGRLGLIGCSRALFAGEQLVTAHAQSTGQFLKVVQPGQACIRLPLANGLAADVQLGGQRLLRKPGLFAQGGNALTDGHRIVSFFYGQRVPIHPGRRAGEMLF